MTPGVGEHLGKVLLVAVVRRDMALVVVEHLGMVLLVGVVHRDKLEGLPDKPQLGNQLVVARLGNLAPVGSLHSYWVVN